MPDDEPAYYYQVVSGSTVFGRPYTMSEALLRVHTLQAKWPLVEVERVLIMPGRIAYWRWRNGNWNTKGLMDDPNPYDLAHWHT